MLHCSLNCSSITFYCARRLQTAVCGHSLNSIGHVVIVDDAVRIVSVDNFVPSLPIRAIRHVESERQSSRTGQ